jgi:hypothetical protein
MRRSKGLKSKVLLVILSLIVGLLICEIIVRFVRPASDIFPAKPTADPILGIRLLPFQSGHDRNGFRNQTAKGYFPIVCIGDSMIYSVGVPRRYAIPQQLSRLVHQRVYNMGLGSYGPVQYYQLLKNSRAMHPQKTIISIFLGNDLLDAAAMVTHYSYWKGLAKTVGPDSQLNNLSFCPLPIDKHIHQMMYEEPNTITIKLKKPGSIMWEVHSFLRLHSALYDLTYEGLVKPLIRRFLERKVYLKLPGALYYPQVDTVFLPGVNLTSMNLHSHNVRLGLLVTKRVIEFMAQLPGVRENRKNLLFFITPTKENVYYNYLTSQKVTLPPQFACAVFYEQEISRWLRQIIKANGFRFVDVFPPMEQAANRGVLLYQPTNDAHPNIAGYRIIAETLAKALKKQAVP